LSAQPIRRYAFDTVFDSDGAVLSEGARTRSYTMDEVDHERANAYAAGRDDEIARAEAQIAQTLSDIAAATSALTTRLAADRREMLADAAHLALAAARKAAGVALEAFGGARVTAALEDAFDTFVGAPRVVIRVSPDMQGVRERLDATARDHGFNGALVVRVDPAVRAGDVTIDWGEGSIAHNSEEALRRIEDMVLGALARETDKGHAS
jgi:flagellar assembly protein FliH